MAEHQGASEDELTARILEGVPGNRFLKSYVKTDKFNEHKWREDRERATAKLNDWHRTHPEEVTNLRKAAAATRRRVSHT
jgi:hypothetical protein